ncbi:MAG: glycosyltransferase [Anaerolineae bacterium]|nr:MAG: glycosyltransferase [Anaerolineae bacterium]
MTAKLSCCMIVRDCVGTLEAALKSARPYCDELVVVDTGSTDGTMDLARKYADKVELFLGCNDADNRIADFSSARNRSFDLATGDWVMWIDSDDELVGGEHIRHLMDQATKDNVILMLPYEYAHDATGRCTCIHWRERIVRPAHRFQWQSPIHEVLLPIEPIQGSIETLRSDLVRVIHRRKGRETPGLGDDNRNLRILKAHVAKTGESDVRALYYIGLEYGYAGDLGRAIRYLRRYVDLSQWNDEKCLAVLELARLYSFIGDHKSAVDWALQASIVRAWPDAYFRLARCFYSLGIENIEREYNFKRCAHFIQLGMQMGDRDTVLFVDPTDDYRIHEFLNVVLSALGDLDGAIASCEAGLAGLPDNQHLLTNHRIYTGRRAIKRAKAAIGACALSDAQRLLIERTLDGDLQVEVHEDGSVSDRSASPSAPQARRQAAPGKLDLVFLLGHQMEPWNPETAERDGIGGSETMAIGISKRLAAMGHAVRLYGQCTPTMEGTFDGVEYIDASKFQDIECDVMIASRKPMAVDAQYNVRAKARVLWVHDVHVGDQLDFSRYSRFDRILCLTDWHKRYFASCYRYPEIASKIVVMRNAIDLERFAGAEERDPHRAIYSSSPDRGLQALLDCWPDIRAQVPDATLHVYYGFHNWKTFAQMAGDEVSLRTVAHLEHLASNMAGLGVVFHDRVNQRELAREFMRSGVWAYPTWFDETSCITAMEATAAGCEIVATHKAGLGETVSRLGLDGDLIEWDRDDQDYSHEPTPEYRAAFVARVVECMQRESGERPLVGPLSFEERAREWDWFLDDLIADKAERIVPKFVDAPEAA